MRIKSLYASLRPLLVKAWNFSPYKLFLALLLMLSGSITSGVGILMIIPLMASVGIDMSGQSSSLGFANTINEWAVYFGVSLNLGFVLLLYLLLIVVMAVTTYLNLVILSSFRHSFVMHLRKNMSRALFYAQWRYLNQNYMADFVRLLTAQVQGTSASLHLLLNLVSSLILVAVYLCFSLYLSLPLTLIALVCGLMLAGLLWPVNKRIHASGGIGLMASQEMHRALFENLASLKIIKSFAAEEQYLQRMDISNREMETQQIRMAKISGLTRFVNTVGAAVIFTVLFYSAIKWLQLPVSNLLVILFIFSRLMPQISSIQGFLQSLIHQAPSYQDLLKRSDELKQWAEVNNDTVQAPSLKQKLVLKDLEFSYIESNEPILKGLSATILSNQTLAIVGPSGVGKSTLADLISGLLEPTSGQISVDGVEITNLNRLAWRRKVAYVTQDVFLFHESVRSNLTWVINPQQFGASEVTDEELWRVLELAAGDEFVKNLPNGLDTLIGDRGVKLSGGERQRLALARALLSKPEVLILDEATSALDRSNEIKIRDALVNLDGKLTIIIIAHNETTIEHVTQRLQLEPQ